MDISTGEVTQADVGVDTVILHQQVDGSTDPETLQRVAADAAAAAQWLEAVRA